LWFASSPTPQRSLRRELDSRPGEMDGAHDLILLARLMSTQDPPCETSHHGPPLLPYFSGILVLISFSTSVAVSSRALLVTSSTGHRLFLRKRSLQYSISSVT